MFAGVISLSSNIHPCEILDVDGCRTALSPYHKPDKEGVWEDGTALLVEARLTNTPASHLESPPCRCPESGVVVLFWGRLDNRADLATVLNIDRNQLAVVTDPQLVLAAWHRWQTAMPEHLLGDFALAVWDPVGRRILLARDPVGVKPLYYRLDHKALLFATTMAVFRTLKKDSPSPDLDWMARYLNQSAASERNTCLVGVVKLPPGHRLLVDEQGTEGLQRYFFWRDDPPPAKSRDQRWVEEYRAILEEAVRCRMTSHYPLASENSGGLDSSAVTAYLAYLLGNSVDRLHVVGVVIYDQEPHFIFDTCRKYKINHIHLTASNKDLDDLLVDRVVRVMGYPADYFCSGYYPFVQECELRGVRTLFSGFGGDEVATYSGRLLPIELLDRGLYRQLWEILPGTPYQRLRSMASMLIKGRPTQEYIPTTWTTRNAMWCHRLVREEVVERLSLMDAYLYPARFDAPYRRINDYVLQSSLKYLDSGGRLESGTLMGASHGVESCWPLADVRLIQQYLSTPSIEKMGPKGVGRYLHRRGIEGVVPHQVAWKPSKDMGHAPVIKEWEAATLTKTVPRAQHQEAILHPALESLIDRKKFREQIKMAQQGGKDISFILPFFQNTTAIRFLNHWLHGGPPG